MALPFRSPARQQRGTTMIEVLVTVIIIAFGLLGMAGLQARLQLSEVEAYQRSQALLLLSDMASRIATNRLNASSYNSTSYDPGSTCPSVSSSSSTAQRDLSEWCNALKGAGEVEGGTCTNSSSAGCRGAMIGARGCVALSGSDYMVTIAWQGMTPISAPPSSVTCGANQYDGGLKCTSDLCRRTVTTLVRIGSLT
jgi:type IV pilus assembly protein PilV